MTLKVTAACLQLNSGPNIEANLERIAPMIEEASSRGAKFITLPENADFKVSDRDKLYGHARTEDKHPAIPFFAKAARDNNAWILAGSLAIRCEHHKKLHNRSYLFSPDGGVAGRYNKIHMFDADVGVDETYRESNSFEAGDRAVICETPWGKVGLTICYDLRFPHLYRTLAKAGASIITVPAAYTVPTGKLHWHVLLRARAIETGCYIIAPGQCGTHDGGRKTYGHSLIVAPTGDIVAEAGETPEVITFELNLAKVADIRRMLPCLEHDRAFDTVAYAPAREAVTI